MDVRHWSERGLAGSGSVEQPSDILSERMIVVDSEFGKDVVGMLMIDQRVAVVRFAGLKEFGKTRMGRSQGLGRKHFTKQERAAGSIVLLHEHQPIDGLGFARAPRPALLVVIEKDDAVCHKVPGAEGSHPCMRFRRSRLPSRARTDMRGGYPVGYRVWRLHVHAGHVCRVVN